jgi:hypothetical protein
MMKQRSFGKADGAVNDAVVHLTASDDQRHDFPILTVLPGRNQHALTTVSARGRCSKRFEGRGPTPRGDWVLR